LEGVEGETVKQFGTASGIKIKNEIDGMDLQDTPSQVLLYLMEFQEYIVLDLLLF